jgi:hypothetical protein
MQLADYIGENVLITLKPRGTTPSITKSMLLLGVEAGGIWIESQEATNQILSHFAVATAPKTLAFFFPYSEFWQIGVPMEKPSLNEKAFGV